MSISYNIDNNLKAVSILLFPVILEPVRNSHYLCFYVKHDFTGLLGFFESLY